MLNCRRLGKGLGTREHLFVSVKINFILAIATSNSKRAGSKNEAKAQRLLQLSNGPYKQNQFIQKFR